MPSQQALPIIREGLRSDDACWRQDVSIVLSEIGLAGVSLKTELVAALSRETCQTTATCMVMGVQGISGFEPGFPHDLESPVLPMSRLAGGA